MDIDSDSDDIDINFDIPSYVKQKPVTYSKFNWRQNAEEHSLKAQKIIDRFYADLDLYDSGLVTPKQAEILYYSIRHGLNSVFCMDGIFLEPGKNYQEIFALEDIEPEEYTEQVLLEVMQNGIYGNSGFISNPAKKWQGDYLYKHLENILETNNAGLGDDTFQRVITDIFNVWTYNVENNKYRKDFVCYNHSLIPIKTLFKIIDPTEVRVENHGDELAYTFREFWDWYRGESGDPPESPQQIVNRWERAYVRYDESMFDGGRYKKNKLTLKKKYKM